MMAILNKFRRQKPQQKPDQDTGRYLRIVQNEINDILITLNRMFDRINRVEERVSRVERIGQRVSKIERRLSRKRKGPRK